MEIPNDDMARLLGYIEYYSGSTWIAAVALLVGAFFLRAIYMADKNARPNNIYVIGVGVSLLLFVAALGLREWHANTIPTTTPKEAFEALKINKRVSWVIRLIPYSSQTEPGLSIAELKTLGSEHQKYVFVADYDELKNLNVREAVNRTGLSLVDKDAVSAIIFPLRSELYPASARGVLKVMREVDAQNVGKAGYRPFDVSRVLDSEALRQLDTLHIPSWRWEAYSMHYKSFRGAVEVARRDRASALEVIGALGPDWHPAGYSEDQNAKNKGDARNSFKLRTNDKTEIDLPNFGARAFLIENFRIRDIKDAILIQFGNPDEARIPDFVGRAGGSSIF